MTQQKKNEPKGEREINAIESDIERTRQAISGDLREIGERLSPEHIKEEVKHEVAKAATEAKDAAGEKIREVKDAAVEKFNEVKDMATEKLHTATDVAAEKLHTATDAAAEKFREVKDAASETVSHAVETVSETYDHVRDGAVRAGESTLGFVRANAVPLTLLGLGAAWLIANQRSRSRDGWRPPYSGSPARLRSYGEGYRTRDEGRSESRDYAGARGSASGVMGSAKGAASRVRDKASGAVDEVRREVSKVGDKTSEYVSRAEERAHELADRAGHAVSDSAHRARDLAERELHRARDLAESNPIALGAAALIAGVGIGLLLPATRKENELLGPSRDKLMDGAKETVHEIEAAAKDLGHTAKETAREMKNGLSGSLSGH